MRKKKKSQQGTFEQHTKPYKAGVCRLLSAKMALGFQSPKNLRIRPQELSAELQKCGKIKKFNAYFRYTQLCCCFLLFLSEKMQMLLAISFSFFISLLSSSTFSQGKKKKEAWFFTRYGEKDILLYSLILKAEGMRREWEIMGYFIFLLVLLLNNPCVLHSCLLFPLAYCTNAFFFSVPFVYFSDVSIKPWEVVLFVLYSLNLVSFSSSCSLASYNTEVEFNDWEIRSFNPTKCTYVLRKYTFVLKLTVKIFSTMNGSCFHPKAEKKKRC